LFSLYSIWISFTFWKEEAVFYFFLRHIVIFYYALFFFAGYKWGHLLLDWLGKVAPLLFVLTLFKFFIFKGFGLSYAAWFGLLWLAVLKKYPQKKVFLFGCVFMVLMHYFIGTSGTDKAIAYFIILIPLFLPILRWWKAVPPSFMQKFAFRFVLLMTSIFLIWGAVKLGTLVFEMNAAGNAVEDLSTFTVGSTNHLNPFEDFIDFNAMWRISFWVYLLSRFFEHPFGIGLGTPFFDPQIAYFLHLSLLPGDEYLIPAHNFFLTLLVRLGVPFLVFFYFSASYTIQLVIAYLSCTHFRPLKDGKSRLVLSSLIIFLMSLILASFNVVVESPLFAWFFWLTFGLFVRLSGDYIAEHNPREVLR